METGSERAPLRQCAVTRIQRPTEDLVRFVLDPSETVTPDLKCKLPGRGVWVTAASDCVEEAVQRSVFSRQFRSAVTVPPDLPVLVGELLLQEALQRLSLANKAGLVVSGFAKVESALNSPDLSLLVHAEDGAADGRRKLDGRFEAQCQDRGRSALIINCFSNAQLSLALGRSNVIHAAVHSGGAADKFLMAARRYERYAAGREAYAAA